MYSKQCKRPQVQKNSPSTLFRVLTALKHVKTAFKSKVLGFSICLYFSMFLCILVSLSLWFLGFLVPSFFSPSVSLVSLDS